ncbi:MAG: DUF790 family protein [Metallosphaera sp.]|uniref:DUF790 family protein n=1 Tax=Metallosphaera cuprina (strain Ar-4) TaxID=1006006 RepID=F4FYZ3_METCR|nr:DUF790 family protein [Metallosphaera cuprina]AEB95563.1 conserved hypothetical protein [Metallosphaera cuprina Ar-4]
MLPSELVRFKIHGDRIYPLFIGKRELDLINEMISIYKPYKTFGEVEEEVKLLERVHGKTTHGAKLVRGLHKVISRYLTLSEESTIDSKKIRAELFSKGPALSEEERKKRIAEVSEMFNVDAEKLMYADLEESKIIKEVKVPSAIDIAKEYNLSLFQSILFKSYKVTFSGELNWKELLRTIKRLGLMYIAYPNPVKIDVIGPYTLVKPSEKYGRNLALLIPYVVSSPSWQAEAEIVLGRKKRRIYMLKVENLEWISSNSSHEKIFDSSIEESFYWDFRNAIKDWKLEREPGPIVVNGRIFLPDFIALKDHLEVFIEIVGFWTEDYIREKVKKLEGSSKLIIPIVNEELGTGRIEGLQLVTYKRKVDVTKVYKLLKQIEASNVRKIDYKLWGDPVISLKEIASKYGVSEATLRKDLMEFPEYVLLKNYYVKRDLLELLSKEDYSGRKLQDVIKEKGEFIVDVLEKLGYKIKWINISEAVISK